ncbi:hypothetical protein B7494_g1248 [Chlorociboria aeruginascens]|nr:hypothetical protein B7494_g1248 [Chlorociboria aeruginascens]
MTSSPSNYALRGHAGDINTKEAEAGIMPSHGISIDIPDAPNDSRPPILQHIVLLDITAAETLNARSEYTNNEEDGRAEHHINQYIIKHEIGRGSFGAVHLAVDQYGKEYAVKEFSKSRLRKRAQSNILRRPRGQRQPGHLAAGMGFNSPLHRHSASDIHDIEEQGNPLFLIKEEIAIMKKLNHPNLVSLIEVLDDPEEDSLYMVLEMCKKGVIMKVGLNEKADPYDEESCRCWFRDLILGIEYLHAQGVVHRDIKPDNLLLTEDDVLKIVDFGVSEMFEKESDMMTAKSAGSPAFLPPELCVTKHGDVSGRAADIWSMGISLYCLRFGRIPFEKSGVLDLYEAIKNDSLDIDPECEPDFIDVIQRLLEKDPKKRITMERLRAHPWVTKNGTDPLLSAEENTANLVEPPTEIEVNHAITAKMMNLMVLMKAVKKFKSLLDQRRPTGLSVALGKGVRTFQTRNGLDSPTERTLHKSKSIDLDDRRAVEVALATEGIHHKGHANKPATVVQKLDTSPQGTDSTSHSVQKSGLDKDPETDVPGLQRRPSFGDRGHAHDPSDEQPHFFGIGAGGDDSLEPPEVEIVAESPAAAEFSIYDTAYQNEVERIRASHGHSATVYLNRRVDSNKEYEKDENMINAPQDSQIEGMAHQGWKGHLDRVREKDVDSPLNVKTTESRTLSDIATKAFTNTKALGLDISTRGGMVLDKIRKKSEDG